MISLAIFSKVVPAVKSFAGNGLLIARKHAPEIMIGAGIAGFGGTIYATAKATLKTNEILEKRDALLDNVAVNQEYNPSYSEKDKAEDEADIKHRTRWRIVKAWAPVATLGTASVISILGGYRILNGRYVATAAAYKVLENSFDRYRGNVVNRFGKDMDWKLLNGMSDEELEKARREKDENRRIDAENKRRKIGKKPKKTKYSEIYQGIFDDYSEHWQRYWTPQQVLHYLKRKQQEMNDRLRIQKHLFVNEVYDALGMPRTPEGAVTGWIVTNANKDTYVSLGIDEMPDDELRSILAIDRNEDIRVKIRLNPDGLIYDMIGKRGGDMTDIPEDYIECGTF